MVERQEKFKLLNLTLMNILNDIQIDYDHTFNMFLDLYSQISNKKNLIYKNIFLFLSTLNLPVF